jgi:MFS transporter, DHA2 family, multidrug resistance protein
VSVAQDGGAVSTAGIEGSAPARGKLVLVTLILVAAVANLNLSVANVALPDIAKDFDASQTQLNLVAVGYSLGLAATVLYLGALGDRYGRKRMLIFGTALAIPASLLAAYAPSIGVLIVARHLGGIAAGMAYPTTLALITALWSGAPRTKSIALWSGIGGAISALGPISAGWLLGHFWWGSVFLLTLPLALVALVLALRLVPSHVHETTQPVDNLGGIISVVLVASLVLAINYAPEPGRGALALLLGVVALLLGVAFVIRQRRARFPLYDLHVAARRTFWVAALAGIIVFGSLMAAMFLGQQYLQNVLEYSPLQAGAAILPAAAFLVLVAPRSAKLVISHGGRVTLLLGYVFCFLAFLTMLFFWKEDSNYLVIAIGYSMMGIGVGFAGTPASQALTGSVPVRRAGMASATADLQRDLGGAVMQSILGALLTAGYSAAIATAIASAPNASQITNQTEAALQKSFASAADLAQSYPQYAPQIIAAAQSSFVDGQDWAYIAGAIAVALGAALVFFLFPKRDEERAMLRTFHEQDLAESATTPTPA